MKLPYINIHSQIVRKKFARYISIKEIQRHYSVARSEHSLDLDAKNMRVKNHLEHKVFSKLMFHLCCFEAFQMKIARV